MTKKIEAALITVKTVRQELGAATRSVTKAAKNVATLEAKLLAAQQELDTAATRAEAVLKKVLATTKDLDTSKVKKVPAVRPAPKNQAKPLPVKPAVKPTDKKPTRAELAAAAKVGSPNDGKRSASRPLKTAPTTKRATSKLSDASEQAKPSSRTTGVKKAIK